MAISSAVTLCCCLVPLFVSLSFGYNIRNIELPTLRVAIYPTISNEETVLHKPPNSQLIVGEGEEIALKSRIKLECEAGYPVQFIYTGDGMPEYTTNTSQQDNTKDVDGSSITKPRQIFEAQLFIGYARSLGYYDSGKYTCRSLQDATRASHYYLFVSDGKLFVRSDGDTIYFRRSDLSVRIPCSVTNPKAVVSLQKSVNGLVQCPLNDSISFEPTAGFHVKISNRFDPAGTYVCTAGNKGTYQAMQYVLVADGQSPPSTSPDRNQCRRDVDCSNDQACLNTGNCGSPCSASCGQNTSCRTVNHLAQCKCLPGFGGDPYIACRQTQSTPPTPQPIHQDDPCHPFPCGRNTVCDNHNGIAKCSCAQDYQGDPYYRCYPKRDSNPCNPNPCGPHSNCVNRNNYASCSCAQGFIGTPPHCRAECENDQHCGYNQVCRQYRCRNPCEGACNDIPNTQCRVINKRPVCARVQYRCPPGYYGRDCSTVYERETVTSQSQPPVIAVPNEETPEPEVISPCVPFPCGSNAECTTRTTTNAALNETTDVALCQCPPGKTGNADVECFAVDELKGKSDALDAEHHDLPSSDDEERTEEPIVQDVSSSVAPSTTVEPLTSTTTTGSTTAATTTTTTTTTTVAPTKAAKKCGTNAIAILSPDGKSVCSCPVGFTGLASIECHILNEDQQLADEGNESNLVEPEYCDGANTSITCGNNAYCAIINGTETCQCMRPFRGNPEIGCELQCDSDSDCPSQYKCYEESGRCVDPCEPTLQMFFKQCGRDAFCKVEDHKPVCYCPKDLPHGSPELHCKEKAWMPTHLPPSPLPTCDKKADDCGNNTECRIFHDSNTYCVCKPGYYGSPYGEPGCELGLQCKNSTQCPPSKECINGKCLDPCRSKQVDCGLHAGCSSDEHKAKCICNIGTIRNPDGACEPVKGALAERMAFFRSFEDFRRK
ncbi:EGF, latrophilin and seven transmembrane domain-containing protein 1 [Orchesella cincta]|uniref:EGF, latrophilin and seven transmembrane domain-containing protein 1 n=1 Tax=Orchesella cincta TaxID=48709 RepID=A0A1D2N9I0_ORCCI|nr:EGF, latrophilin and seven transmembrane domain-containing protein 1 [Orchesella cincta]